MGTLRTTLSHAGMVVNGVTLGEPAEPAYKTYDHPLIPNGQIADDGTILVYDRADVDDPAAAANREAIRAQARDALQRNRDYIASTPTAADAVAASKDHARQLNGVIRLLLTELSDTD